jgi:hypothetical protein
VLRDWSLQFEAQGGEVLDRLELGHEGLARATAISAASPSAMTRPGMTFEVREGGQVVARGSVLEVIDDEL